MLPSTRIFAADWPTLGADRAALLWGSEWRMHGGQGLEVVPSTGLDLPMPHVLRVTAVGATSGHAFLRKTGLQVPAIGERRFYRWYFRATMPDGLEDQESHPFQDGNASSQSNWLFHVWHNRGGAGRWTPEIRASGNAWPDARWYGPALSNGVTYRFELQLHRTADSIFTLTPRIHDARGALLAGPEAFTNEQGRTGLESFSSRIRNPAELGGLNAGLNGIAGSPQWPFVYGYQAGVAVCARERCGPWTP